MTKAQCIEGEANRELTNNPEQTQGTPNPAMNPRKITKKNSYIRTLDDTFKQAREIDRECPFVDALSGKYNEQTTTQIEIQINELDDSFQDCDINAMSTRLTNR